MIVLYWRHREATVQFVLDVMKTKIMIWTWWNVLNVEGMLLYRRYFVIFNMEEMQKLNIFYTEIIVSFTFSLFYSTKTLLFLNLFISSIQERGVLPLLVKDSIICYWISYFFLSNLIRSVGWDKKGNIIIFGFQILAQLILSIKQNTIFN